MEEEAIHPLDQLAAARKAETEKSEPVFTVDEKGKMSDFVVNKNQQLKHVKKY